jgi:transposase
MKPTSMDLGKRIVASYDAKEGTMKQVAQRFRVSLELVKKLVWQRNRIGTIEPQYQNQGRKPAFDDKNLKRLDQFVQQHSDVTLKEIQQHFSIHISCSLQAIANALKRLGWRYNKIVTNE